jgi:hypothetical protein
MEAEQRIALHVWFVAWIALREQEKSFPSNVGPVAWLRSGPRPRAGLVPVAKVSCSVPGIKDLVFHAYDARTGRPSMQLSTIDWSGG